MQKSNPCLLHFQNPAFRRMPRATVPNRAEGRLGKRTFVKNDIKKVLTKSD